MIFLACALTLVLVMDAFEPAQAQGSSNGNVAWVSSGNGNTEPDGSQGETVLHQVLEPANLYGLIASITGALVLGTSLMILSRRRA